MQGSCCLLFYFVFRAIGRAFIIESVSACLLGLLELSFYCECLRTGTGTPMVLLVMLVLLILLITHWQMPAYMHTQLFAQRFFKHDITYSLVHLSVRCQRVGILQEGNCEGVVGRQVTGKKGSVYESEKGECCRFNRLGCWLQIDNQRSWRGRKFLLGGFFE